MYNVQCTVYSVQSTEYSIRCTVWIGAHLQSTINHMSLEFASPLVPHDFINLIERDFRTRRLKDRIQTETFLRKAGRYILLEWLGLDNPETAERSQVSSMLGTFADPPCWSGWPPVSW